VTYPVGRSEEVLVCRPYQYLCDPSHFLVSRLYHALHYRIAKPMAPRIHLYICLLLATARTSLSFTAQSVRSLSCSGIYSDPSHHNLISIRGGDQDISNDNDCSTTSAKNSQMSAIAAFVMAGAHHYSKALERNPIVTKSMTASFVFVASDLLAQYIEKGTDNNKKLDKKRTVGASLVGLLYFGPAAHFWYENIFRLFPGTS